METNGTLNGRARVAVVVVGDDEDTRLFLKEVSQPGNTFTFAGAFSNGKEALKAIPRLRPDLALMDVRLPDMDGVECTKRLKHSVPNLKVVILSENRETTSFDRSLSAGAVAYLIKPVDPDQLIATLLFASAPAGSPINIPPAKLEKVPKAILNPREKTVLSKLAEGLLYKEISALLGISYAAVHKCQHRIFMKLGATNRSEAIRIWLQNKAVT